MEKRSVSKCDLILLSLQKLRFNSIKSGTKKVCSRKRLATKGNEQIRLMVLCFRGKNTSSLRFR